MNTKSNSPMPFYSLLVISFFTILYVNDIVLYKLVSFYGVVISASSLVFPLTFLISDIIAEVYGYKTSRRLIWVSLIFNIIFGALVAGMIRLPSPTSWGVQSDFNIVFKNIFFIALSHIIATPLGYLINVYLMSKWKVAWKGRFFIIRSILSSAIGELAFSAAMVFYIWYGSGYHVSLITLTLFTYGTKLIWNFIGSYPAAILVRIAKKVDHVDTYDYGLKYKIFGS